MKPLHPIAATVAALFLASSAPAFARADQLAVTRVAPDKVSVTWSAKGPVDLFWADRPVTDPADAKLVSAGDRDGKQEVAVDVAARPYFLVRDKADGTVVDVAERLVPLEQGSNFRDVGGYRTTDGKAVRWGRIYRSGASAMLTPGDLARVQALGLVDMVDLRSSEERVLAPTRIEGVRYAAVGYSMQEILRMTMQGPSGALYANLPTMLKPQLRIVFDLLKRHEGPVAYNCSAGQDRTGFATAMVLSALGVPRETILADYHLSTAYRQPRWEMPPIDLAAHPNDPVAQVFSRGATAGDRKPAPLYDAEGKSLLLGSFAAIDAKYGSVEGYLEKEIGVTPADIAALRATYLE